MTAPSQPPVTVLRDPAVDRASPGRWRTRVDLFITSGRERLAALGVVLVLGFMLGVLALVLFAGLSQTVVAGDTMTLDTRVLLWLRQFQGPVVDIVARVLSAMGSEVLAVLGVVLLVVFLGRRRWGAAVALLVTTVGAQLLNNVLKVMFQRT